MPTYQYACTECDHRFDAVQSFTDSALTECPQCHGRLRKLFGAVGVVFKGSGFYRTDSRSGGKSSTVPAGAASGDSSSSTSSSTSTTSPGTSSSSSSSSTTSSSGSGTAAAS
ncbi:FmdB family zinc ribbon protein [Umezawaea beigongshangensis]|uniref:FmdB family zinc ribbon protein n=1 Tax=Umezawaea beigongshangensis TaxID=2780383 RepID=UPI0018F1B069|nr:FmdB family zinc ribbon protein [Umezawaea beigongshangensis]